MAKNNARGRDFEKINGLSLKPVRELFLTGEQRTTINHFLENNKLKEET